MAVRSKAASRLPEEQLREREKDGRIRRFICGVLTLRVLAYIIAQPASFTFITSFLFITLTMPPMAAYIKNAGDLPDLDTMRSWNAYLGRLSNQKLCVHMGEPQDSTWPSPPSEAASAFVDFHIDKDVLDQAMNDGVTMVVGVLPGTLLRTKIKDSNTDERIDELVNATIFLPLTDPECGNSSESECTVRGCIDIRAPGVATPSRHPQIPHSNFTFSNRVLQSYNKPDGPLSEVGELNSCFEHYQHVLRSTWNLTLGEKCGDVRPHKEKYRKHGLISTYLTKKQKEQSYIRINMGTLCVAVIGLAFGVGISCTERPPKPKNRPE